jgi:O-methyltransferase
MFIRILKLAWHLVPVKFREKFFLIRLVVKGLPVIPNPTFAEDGLISSHLVQFIEDPKFVSAYKSGKETGALAHHPGDIRFRAYIACWAGSHAMKLEGDFVECGVGKGLLSKTVVKYLNFEHSNKTFWLFDTYKGIPVEQSSTEEELRQIEFRNEHFFSEPYIEQVQDTFKDYRNVKIVQGVLPGTLESQELASIAYLSIDMNNANAEIETIKKLWNRICKMGIILVDDYAYGIEFQEQTRAWDTFAQDNGISILTVPTGQGLIIKQ